MPAACQSSVLHPSTFAFRGFEGAKRQRLCQPSGNPLGPNLAGVSLFRCVLTGDAGGCDVPLEWLMPHGFAQGRYVRPTNACRLPKLPASTVHLCFLVGAKVPNGSGSADLVATRCCWGFPCFGCVLTGDAGGCDVPLERLMPHGAARGRYVRPTNACCLPKLPASPAHLCF